MSLPGYDAWKLATPWDDMDEEEECPYCGAMPGQGCGLEAEQKEPPCLSNPPRLEPDPDRAYDEWRDRQMERDIDEEVPF